MIRSICLLVFAFSGLLMACAEEPENYRQWLLDNGVTPQVDGGTEGTHYPSGYSPASAFDGSVAADHTKRYLGEIKNGSYLTFGAVVADKTFAVTDYRICQSTTGAYSNDRAPTEWTLYGGDSLTGDAWTKIEDRSVDWGTPTGQSATIPTGDAAWRTFTLSPVQTWPYYKIVFNKSRANNITWDVGVMEIEFLSVKHPANPEANVTSSFCKGDGKRNVNWTIVDYGYLATTAGVKVVYSTSPDYSGAAETVCATALSSVLPISQTTVLTGLTPDAHYYAKLVVSNNLGKVTEVPFEFVEQDVAETYYWVNGEGGSWQDSANWRLGSVSGTVPTDYPRSADVVRFGAMTKSFAITTTQDIEVSSLIFYPDAASTPTIATIDLNGHAFTAKTEINARSIVNFGRRTILRFLNGTVSCETYKKGWNQDGGFCVDRESNSNTETGHMILDHVTANYLGNFELCGNHGTLTVTNGTTVAGGNALYNNGNGSFLHIAGQGTVVTGELGGLIAGGSQANGLVATTLVERAAFAYMRYIEVAPGTLGDALVIDNAEVTAFWGNGYSWHTVGYTSGAGTTGNAKLVARNNAKLTLLRSGLYVGMTNADGANAGNRHTTNNVVRVESGAVLDSTEIHVGRQWGRANRIEVENGTVRASKIYLGVYSPARIGGVDYAGASSNNWLYVSGTNSLVSLSGTGSALPLSYQAGLRFAIPPEGYCQTPVQATSGKLTCVRATIPGYEDKPSRIVIAADDFARAHPDTTIDLMTFAADSTAGFNELMENFVYEGKDVFKGTLSITNGGKTLSYTTPRLRGMVLLFR